MDDSNSIDDLKRKHIHPKKNAGLISNLFFWWGLSIFFKGWNKDINEDDLYKPLKEHESHRLGDKLEEQWKIEKMSNKKPKLWRALWRMFKKDILLYGFVLFILEFILRVSQPLALEKLVDFYAPQQKAVSRNEAYIYASFIVVTSFIYVLINHSFVFGLQHLGLKMRVACCSLIYRKSLRLSKTALAQTTTGQMVNLMSNDVNRFNDVVRNFHYLWAAPLESLLIMYLLYNLMGVTAISGFGLFFLFIPLQLIMGRYFSNFRMKTAIKTDERVRFMNEIISGIQVIKMYTWEKTFSQIVQNVRKLEMEQIRNSSYLRAIHISFNKFTTRIAVFLCIIAYALTGNNPNAEYVYLISSFYNILKDVMTSNFPQAISSLCETIVSMKRIESFLMLDEIHIPNPNDNYFTQIVIKPKKHCGVNLKSASAKWFYSTSNYTVHDLNFSAGPTELVAIIGPVGSGKSSLLNIILKELPLLKGNKNITGKISYACQEPWLFTGTIRQNILFGEDWNKEKYENVVKVCALERDFTLLPCGDKSFVGDRGVSLSGGQRARINLARTIYKDADIYLLDDPLSAVDTHVGKQLFEECILNYLKNKCTILVTHQLQYLKPVNKIYLMERGRISITGTYQEIQQSSCEFAKLLKKDSNEDIDDTIDDEDDNLNVTSEICEEPNEIREQRCSGSISPIVYKSYLRAGGGILTSIVILMLFVLTQLVSSISDYFVSFWVNLEQAKLETEFQSFYKYFDDVLLEEEFDEISTESTTMLSSNTFFTTSNCFHVYTIIIVVLIIVTIMRSLSFYKFCVNASSVLHNKMFKSVLHSNMHFFSTNSSGRVLNRFSKDIGAVDETCPYVLMDSIQIGLNVLAVNIIIATVNPWILIPSFIIFLLFYIYRILYLATSRNLKRIESTTRSPVITHLNASLQGLTTVRAFGAQEILRIEFDRHQDLHSSAFYMFLSCNSTFGFWLDFHCVFYVALVTISFFFMENNTYGGKVGLAITQAISLTGMFQWGMRQWSELENSMTSVERVIEYTDLEQEESNNKIKPFKSWPEYGCLEFQSVYLRYAFNQPYVLNNLSFKINPMEKVGIVGRTGAGKSSLISALFKLATTEGKILIDGLNTKDIALSCMRTKLSIIPQQPVIFSGTLRYNLDPYNEYSDEELWNAIELSQLKEVITAGLDSYMSQDGANLSVGQKQLVCLARAIVRNNKILVLDEATANVDAKTDLLIQTAIRTIFVHCTVLTIAHRLHTVMDSDKVIVINAGSVVEFDHPHLLLQNKDGLFCKLVKETGKTMAEHLAYIAKQSFNKMQISSN